MLLLGSTVLFPWQAKQAIDGSQASCSVCFSSCASWASAYHLEMGESFPTRTNVAKGSGSTAAHSLEEQNGDTKNFHDTDQTGYINDAHTQEGNGPLQSFVIVYNLSKRHNIGTLARCATAFGVSEMILVGKHKDFNSFGSHGASAHLQYRHFYSLGDARAHLKERGCDIIGVEITDGARPVHSHPFTRSAAFLLGNEGTGLSEREMAICDFFIYIAQYGCGTASLNVTVAASIVLHHFSVWAGFPERPRDGQKFVVADRPLKQQSRVICTETPEMVAEMRRLKQATCEDWLRDVEEYENSDLSAVGEQEVTSSHHGSSSALTSLFEA